LGIEQSTDEQQECKAWLAMRRRLLTRSMQTAAHIATLLLLFSCLVLVCDSAPSFFFSIKRSLIAFERKSKADGAASCMALPWLFYISKKKRLAGAA